MGDGEWSTGTGFCSAEDQAGELGGLGHPLACVGTPADHRIV